MNRINENKNTRNEEIKRIQKENLINFFATIFVLILITAFVGGGTWLLYRYGEKSRNEYHQQIMAEYNDGYCSCGGHWHLVTVTSDKYGEPEMYYYECENCKTTLNSKFLIK